jgi:hypothetical protein
LTDHGLAVGLQVQVAAPKLYRRAEQAVDVHMPLAEYAG